MKIIKITQDPIFLTVSMAIFALSTTSFKAVNAQDSTNRVHEIGWSSRLSSMGLDKIDNIGQKYSFYCQPASNDLIHSPVWGTEIYTANSSICSTAVHAGMITKEGGKVTLELLEGQSFYTGSQKNNISSKDHRTTEVSFTFIGEKVIQNKLENSDKEKNEPSGIKKVLGNSVQRGVERTIENAITNIFR
ncbi:MAG: LCCL domain-containing protein [Pleurocapsa sp. MO_192.B19]|nr:LCCL domain-containing protein [Pleurocapsa sp. MO_192.B19]